MTEFSSGGRNHPRGPLAVNSSGTVATLSGDFGELEILLVTPSGQERRLLPSAKQSDPFQPRAITGGRPVPLNQALAVVAVDFFRGGHCTGSLIAPEWVLTAAHCLVDKNSGEIQNSSAISICNNIQDRDTCLHWRIPTDRTIVHPRYRWFTVNGVAASDRQRPQGSRRIRRGAPAPDATCPRCATVARSRYHDGAVGDRSEQLRHPRRFSGLGPAG